MVQYIFTPWRDRHELLSVRHQFYPTPPPATATANPLDASGARQSADAAEGAARGRREDRHRAVARVSMWMQRGNCPHMVESTALLVAAMLGDEEGAAAGGGGAYAVRAAYATAFSRFVTGLLDSHQAAQRKLSMYALARRLSLPAAFVELRHQATHEALPSLGRLRTAARRALEWIWGYYWANLADEADGDGGGDGAGRLRGVLTAYVSGSRDEEQEREAREGLWGEVRRWDEGTVLRVLGEIGEEATDTLVELRSVRLAREVLSKGRDGELGEDGHQPLSDLNQIRAELVKAREGLRRLDEDVVMSESTLEGSQEEGMAEETTGWSEYQGVWKPKPIGLV